MKTLRVTEAYYDLKRNQPMRVGDEFTAEDDRAEKLLKTGWVAEVKETEAAGTEAAAEPARKPRKTAKK